MEIIDQQCNKLRGVLHNIDGCSVVNTNRSDKGLLIRSSKPVPWNESLKLQHGEDKHKIGYIIPNKTGLGLYIDFPNGFLRKDDINSIINPDRKLMYFPQEERVKGRVSWWRLRSNSKYDSIHMVLYAEVLSTYDFERGDLKELFTIVVDAVR